MRYLCPSRILLFLFLLSSEAIPCTCDYGKTGTSALTALRKAKAVFVGKVKAITPARMRDPDGEFTGSTDSFVQFDVERYWKGVQSDALEVIADDPRGCGGPTFQIGESYLVYAYDKPLSTGGCTRSRRLEHASEDLALLGKAKVPKARKQ